MKSLIISKSARITLRNLALAVPWRAAGFLGLASALHAVPPVTNGLVVWLSADSINPADTNQVRVVGADTFVKLWNDGSGGGHHATNATAIEQPQYIASGLNGKPVLRFTEASPSKMFLGDLSGSFPTAASFFAVSTINGDGRYNLFDNCNSDSRWVANTWTESKPGVFRNAREEAGFTYATWPQSGSHVFAMESSSSIYRFVKDGAQIGTATANYYNGSGRNWTIGCRPDGDQTLNGDIPELILYNRVLTTTEADMVGAYLTNKYALTSTYPAPPAPAVPTALIAAPLSSGAIQLTWSSALGATSYNVSATNVSTSVEQVITGVSSPYNFNGLTTGTTYSLKISSTNSTATSAYSAPPVTALSPVGKACDILTFVFPGLPDASISGTSISMSVPAGTNVTNLAPSYTVSPSATGIPSSGSSRNFTSPQTYKITAQDGSTQDYTVTVTPLPASSAKNILTFGPGADISGNNIIWSVPFGTNLTSLAPTYTVSPLSTGSPASGSGVNFTTPQTYTIMAENGSTQSYSVSVISLLGAPTAINVNYSGGSHASLNGYDYNDLSASGSGTHVAPLAYSGNYWNDFNFGGNNSSNLKDSHSLSTGIGLVSTMQAGPWADWDGLGHNRMLISGLISTYPTYTKILALTGLIPAHTYSLAIASLHGTGGQTSTFKVGSVEKALAYTSVTDWTEGKTHVQLTGLIPTADGTLNVEAKSTGELVLNGLQIVDTTPQNDILSFTFPTYGNATISGTNISITVPYGTDVSAFAPTYTLSYGATCVLNSGSTQNFTNPVHYVVTATNNSTKDYTVTVNVNPIPDPQFTLTAPSIWDGRQEITVQATVTNAALLASTGGTNLNYKWSVDGIAAAQTSVAGTMTLTFAQGNGPMTVTLVMDNGGRPTSQTVTINVQQPTNEAWVQRTPDIDEKPVDGQFFARDDSGYGKIFYLGNQSGTPDTVYLKVYQAVNGVETQYGTTLRQALVGGSYNFSAPILGGLYTYKVVYGTTTGGIDSPLATVSNLICGDAYLFEGQSNTSAETPNNGTPPESGYYTSDWIRTYGTINSDGSVGSIVGGWGNAVRTRTWGTPDYGKYQVGCWGMHFARTLLDRYKIPICIINGAKGGTRIDQHLRNEANPEDQSTIYGRLLTRLKAAKLTHGVRAVLWHQGEQDQGREGPYAGDFDYKWYHQNFANVSGAWRKNYPNIKNYYIFQIWPAACGDTSANDMLRETQRTLPYLYSNMRIMSTLGIVPGSGCHYNIPGYEFMANLITPLVEQDHYSRSASEVLTAADLKKAYFTTAAHTEIALEFGQNMAWNPGAPGLIYLDGLAGKVASGSASGAVVKLQLTAPSTASTITYLTGSIPWSQANLLYGSNGIAALTFAQVPLTTSTIVPYTSWITGKGLSSANAAGDADPDHDGIQNALEYVLGGEPNPATVGSNSSPLLPTTSSSNGDMTFTFKRKDASEGAVALSFQWSTDLTFTTFNTVPVGAVSSTVNGIVINVVEDSPDPATDLIVITVPAAKAAGGKLFGRLNATAP